jgi:hypothetical protein
VLEPLELSAPLAAASEPLVLMAAPQSEPSSPSGAEATLWSYFRDRNVRTPNRLQLLRDIVITELPEGLGWRFSGKGEPLVIHGAEAGRIVGQLIPLLNGQFSIDELIDLHFEKSQVILTLKAIQMLHQNGLLVERDGLRLAAAENLTIAQREQIHWSRNLTITGTLTSSECFNKTIAKSKIVIVGTGILGAEVFKLLEKLGCKSLQLVSWGLDNSLRELLGAEVGDSAHFHDCDALGVAELIDFVSSRIAIIDSDVQLVVAATRNAPNESCREFASAVARFC